MMTDDEIEHCEICNHEPAWPCECGMILCSEDHDHYCDTPDRIGDPDLAQELEDFDPDC